MRISSLFLPFFALALTRPAHANASSDELVRQGQLHEACDEADRALRSYTDALALDPTSANAYLGLGSVRMRLGQPREAERVYSTALEHLPTLTAALSGRARARRALGARDLADRDLSDYAAKTESLAAWRELAHWYGEEGRFTAELSVWRGVLEFAETKHDDALESEAHKTIRALAILAKPIDPAAFPPTDDLTRAALANVARRGG